MDAASVRGHLLTTGQFSTPYIGYVLVLPGVLYGMVISLLAILFDFFCVFHLPR